MHPLSVGIAFFGDSQFFAWPPVLPEPARNTAPPILSISGAAVFLAEDLLNVWTVTTLRRDVLR